MCSIARTMNRQQICVPRVRYISISLTLEECFVRFSCVALPFDPVQVRYVLLRQFFFAILGRGPRAFQIGKISAVNH